MNNLTQIDYAEQELLYNNFMKPVLMQSLATLNLPKKSLGIDIGCGPGGLFGLFSNILGIDKGIIGIDISLPHLRRAAQEIGSKSYKLIATDICDTLPFPDACFDWAWIADVLWSDIFLDPVSIINNVARVVKPEGTIAIYFTHWLRSMFLPGYSNLERALYAATEKKYYNSTFSKPINHHENAYSWLKKLGLKDVRIQTFFVQYNYPLDKKIMQYIQEVLFDAEFGDTIIPYALEAGMTMNDIQQWFDISNPQSNNYILNREDYYCVKFGSLIVGKIPALP